MQPSPKTETESPIVEGTPNAATTAYKNDALKLMTHDMVTRMTKYVTSEIQASAEDYVLLEQLNLAAAGRYETLTNEANQTLEEVKEMKKNYRDFGPYLQSIRSLHDNVKTLEETVIILESYVKEVENQVQSI